MKCLLEGKQFIARTSCVCMHFIRNATLHLGEEVVPMPAKKKAARKTAKRKPARRKAVKKTAKKTTKRKPAKKATSRKKKRK